jgi:hypothetical protein
MALLPCLSSGRDANAEQRRGVGRAGVRTTDADVSVYRSRAAEAVKALAATDAEPRLSLVRQAHLSGVRGMVLSMPRLLVR